MDTQERILIGVIELSEAKNLSDKLETKGIHIDIRHNQQTCLKGCVVKVEIWAREEDIEAIAETINAEKMQTLMNEGTEINVDLLNQVFDEDAKTATCPACGTEFSTDNKECPECGLVFIP